MKLLQLRIKREYLHQIKEGTKTSEFRPFSPFYLERIFDDIDGALTPKPYTHIKLFVGNEKDSEFVLSEIKGIFVNQYLNNIPEGMERGAMEIEIELGNIIEQN